MPQSIVVPDAVQMSPSSVIDPIVADWVVDDDEWQHPEHATASCDALPGLGHALRNLSAAPAGPTLGEFAQLIDRLGIELRLGMALPAHATPTVADGELAPLFDCVPTATVLTQNDIDDLVAFMNQHA